MSNNNRDSFTDRFLIFFILIIGAGLFGGLIGEYVGAGVGAGIGAGLALTLLLLDRKSSKQQAAGVVEVIRVAESVKNTSPVSVLLNPPKLPTRSNDCVFCGFLASGTKKGQMVFEDDAILAILDDFPMAEGHTLVILKEHHADLASIAPNAAAAMGRTVARVAAAIKKSLQPEMVYLASVGESVQHVHYHLVPRYSGESKGFVHFMSPRGRLTNGVELAEKIRQALVEPNSSQEKSEAMEKEHDGITCTAPNCVEERVMAALYAHFGVDPKDDEAMDRLWDTREAEVRAWIDENESRFYKEAGFDE